MSVREGTMFGNYRIARPIGTGGFSTVYLAHDDRLDAEVAIKVLAENRALDVDARRRFIEEAQKLRKVQSNAVVTVYDVGETESQQPYMVLEYANRGDLAQRKTTATQPISVDGCLQVVDFLFQALSALHGVGLVHRDVKPHNILIRTRHGAQAAETTLIAGNEHLLLGDLGFVKDLTMASGLTSGGGTWAYQAPEQRHHLSTVDARADIFSASAVMAWLLTGQQPAEGQYWPDLLAQVAIDPALKAELLRGMAESPDDRPENIQQWRAGLISVLTPPPASAATTSIMESPDRAQQSSAVQTNTAVRTDTAIQTDTAVANVPPNAAPPQSPLHPSSQPKPGRRSRLGLWVALATLAVGLGAFGAGWLIRGGAGAEQVSSGGTTTTTAKIDGRQVSISGPTDIRVGESVTFTSEIPAGLSGSWVYPDGSVVETGAGVVYVADSAGSFSVTLVVTANGGDPQLVIHKAQAEP